MSRSELATWSAAFLFSLALHGLVFYRAETAIGLDEREQAGAEPVTRVSFRAVTAPEPAPAPEAPEKPQPPEPVEERETPPPPPKPKPVQREAPQPLPEPKVVEQVAEPQPAPVPTPAPQRSSASPPATTQAVVSAVDEASRAQARRHYLAQLMAHIEAYRHYPRAARRRGIEGLVEVSFTLHDDGRIEGLAVSGGHSLLRLATEEAVEAAQPLPVPPADVTIRQPVRFAMRFNLN